MTSLDWMMVSAQLTAKIGDYRTYSVKLDNILYTYTVYVWVILSEKVAMQKALSSRIS